MRLYFVMGCCNGVVLDFFQAKDDKQAMRQMLTRNADGPDDTAALEEMTLYCGSKVPEFEAMNEDEEE